MKNMKLFMVAVICMLATTLTLKAQTPADYFAGRWSVLVVGTPNGDSKMPITLTRVDGKLAGGIEDGKGGLATKFDRVEEKGNTVTVYFVGGGYNCYITLDKKDDNTSVGSLMDMFDATATRVVEAKK